MWRFTQICLVLSRFAVCPLCVLTSPPRGLDMIDATFFLQPFLLYVAFMQQLPNLLRNPGMVGFSPLPIPALLFQPRVRAFCALELLGPSRRQFPGKKNMVKVRESFRNTGSRNYIFNFVEFKYQFSVFGDPELVVGLGNPFERLNISSSSRWVKRYWIWYSVFYTGIPKLCVRGSVDDQSFLWRKLSFFFRSCGTSG